MLGFSPHDSKMTAVILGITCGFKSEQKEMGVFIRAGYIINRNDKKWNCGVLHEVGKNDL